MQIKQRIEQTQKLTLTPGIQQSLQYLQLSIQELGLYIEELSMRNPLLEVELPPLGEPYGQEIAAPAGGEEISIRELLDNGVIRTGREFRADFTDVYVAGKSFSEHLIEQLGQMKELDDASFRLCCFLVGCLNSTGYMDCPLPELAEELGVSLFEVEQALYVIQMLDPPGVGARDLSECLLIQLAQGSRFNAVNVGLVQNGLPLLARSDLTGLQQLLGVSESEVRAAIDTVHSLNPIPSQGFSDGKNIHYIIPEATVYCENGRLSLEMNRTLFPRVSLQKDYCAMLEQEDCNEAHAYLKNAMSEAKDVLYGLRKRNETLRRLLIAIIKHQRDYFLRGGDLKPMTMSDLARELECSVSTVSRGVRDKYILFDGKLLPLQSLFAASIPVSEGDSVTPSAIKRQLQNFILAEDPAHPLSDETLRGMFADLGIEISRRTIAKYRGELKIPATSQRRAR